MGRQILFGTSTSRPLIFELHLNELLHLSFPGPWCSSEYRHASATHLHAFAFETEETAGELSNWFSPSKTFFPIDFSWKKNVRRRSNGTIEFSWKKCRTSCERPGELIIVTTTWAKGKTNAKEKWLEENFLNFSLNHEKRRRELLRVSRENSTMLKRILDRRPEVTRQSWSDSWSRNLSYLDNISKYNNEWHDSKVIEFVLLPLECRFASSFSHRAVGQIVVNRLRAAQKVLRVKRQQDRIKTP